MLVLTRKFNEGVIFRDEITGEQLGRVVWLGFDRRTGEARIGFDAPDDVIILRDELAQRGDRHG